jgi:hypothetical protein
LQQRLQSYVVFLHAARFKEMGGRIAVFLSSANEWRIRPGHERIGIHRRACAPLPAPSIAKPMCAPCSRPAAPHRERRFRSWPPTSCPMRAGRKPSPVATFVRLPPRSSNPHSIMKSTGWICVPVPRTPRMSPANANPIPLHRLLKLVTSFFQVYANKILIGFVPTENDFRPPKIASKLLPSNIFLDRSPAWDVYLIKHIALLEGPCFDLA